MKSKFFLLELFIFVVLIVNVVQGKPWYESIGKCPEYTSIPNLDLKKLKGVWYDLAEDKGRLPPGVKCSKVTQHVSDNNTLTFDVSKIAGDGSPIKFSFGYENDPKNPMDFLWDNNVTDVTLFGPKSRMIKMRQSFVYTDYDNIEVYYACYETSYYTLPVSNRFFYISVRDRSFNDLNLFMNAINVLVDLGVDLNDMGIVENTPKCTN